MSSGLDWFFENLQRRSGKTAAIWGPIELSYDRLWQQIACWRQRFSAAGLGAGDTCAIVGDQSSDVCAALLAGLLHDMILVPLCSLPPERYSDCFEAAHVQAVLTWRQTPTDGHQLERRAVSTSHPLLVSLRTEKHAGIVLFSSGSTGQPKAVLWDAQRLIARHRATHRAYRTLVFLRLDHIGGLNTLFHALCGGETLVVPQRHDLDTVCQAIERDGVELLPTTPTFLKMLLLSGALDRFDLSSLRRITYGTEPMHPGVLQSLAAALPNVDFKQTYGLSEVGILPTKSADRDSLWLKLGGGDVQTRIVDGQLWIRTPTAMCGYLNHPSPFDSEGWYNTQDAVEVQGEYLRILGRTSDIINVAGEKVYPAEVEDVLLAAGNVCEAAVCGRRNPITGQVVTARVSLLNPETPAGAERRLIAFCRQRLAPFQVPVLIEVTSDALHTERGKTIRASNRMAA